MSSRRISSSDLRVAMFTWNVAVLNPPESSILRDLISVHMKDSPDMYVVTLQEVSSKPHEVIQSYIEDPWTTAISSHVCGREYVLVSSIRLQGLLLLFYATMKHLPFLYNIHTSYYRTGLGGYWGNNGAVAVRLNCYGRSICFVAAHMSAHTEQWEFRDKEYDLIASGLTFPLESSPRALVHNYTFWLGDLNYRFDNLSTDKVKSLCASNQLQELQERDQLLLTMRNHRAFGQFKEGTIMFIPTYKYDFSKSTFDSSPKARQPAWTDRILWRVSKDKTTDTELDVNQITYDSHRGVLWSDHKPVWADFKIRVSADVGQPSVVFGAIESWSVKSSVCTYTVGRDTKTNSWDWIGLYKVGFQTVDRHYCTYEWADETNSARRVQFSKDYLPTDYQAEYVLCYKSAITGSVLGVSNVFKINPPE